MSRWLLLLALAGCYEVPDASGCMRGCNNAGATCLQSAVARVDGCGEDNECAVGCAQKQLQCIRGVLDCVVGCVQEVEEAL